MPAYKVLPARFVLTVFVVLQMYIALPEYCRFATTQVLQHAKHLWLTNHTYEQAPYVGSLTLQHTANICITQACMGDICKSDNTSYFLTSANLSRLKKVAHPSIA